MLPLTATSLLTVCSNILFLIPMVATHALPVSLHLPALDISQEVTSILCLPFIKQFRVCSLLCNPQFAFYYKSHCLCFLFNYMLFCLIFIMQYILIMLFTLLQLFPEYLHSQTHPTWRERRTQFSLVEQHWFYQPSSKSTRLIPSCDNHLL